MRKTIWKRTLSEWGLAFTQSICVLYGTSLGWMGRLKEGTDVLEKGFRNACEVNDKFNDGIDTIHATPPLRTLQDTGIVQSHTHRKALKSYEEAEISLGLEIAWCMLGAGYYLCGEYDKAIESGEKSLKLAKEFGMPFMVSWSYWHLAMTLRTAGDLRRARECAEEALRISQECNAKTCEGLARILLGCMVEQMTPAIIEEAEHQIRHGISILEELQIKIDGALSGIFISVSSSPMQAERKKLWRV